MPPPFQLSILILLIGWTAAIDFEVGEYVIVRNLKWKIDESIRDAVMQLNNSVAKFMSHNTHRSERHEFTVQSLEDPPVQLAVPRKKLQHLSRMMIYDYSLNISPGVLRKLDRTLRIWWPGFESSIYGAFHFSKRTIRKDSILLHIS